MASKENRKALEQFNRERCLRIELTPADYARAVEIARIRRSAHTFLHQDNTRTTDDPHAEDVRGCCGEVGVERWDPRFRVNVERLPGGDKGHDCVVGDWKIDIKTIQYLDGTHNLLQQEGYVTSDIYLLAVKEPWDNTCIWLRGWCRASVVLAAPLQIKNASVNKMDHVLGLTRLEPITTLQEFLGGH